MRERNRRDGPYHHGDLRTVVLAEAMRMIESVGPLGLSLRGLARRTGVAHTSITHHFEDKAGLFTAVAVEGFELLAKELQESCDDGGSFLDLGVAYARFAAANREYFEVMFSPELYRPEHPEVVSAKKLTTDMLYGQAGELSSGSDDRLTVGVAGWALVHGLATLWHHGALPDVLGDDLEIITRQVAVHLGTR